MVRSQSPARRSISGSSRFVRISLTFDKFLELVGTFLGVGFYLGEAVLLKAIRKARRFAAEDGHP